MPLLRACLATSMDGYVADPAGGFDFLSDFPPEDVMGDGFIDQFGAFIMGRRTYDQVLRLAPTHAWPYEGKPLFVLTRRPLGSRVPKGVEAVSAENDAAVDAVARTALAAADGRDVWHLGGPASLAVFDQRGLIDRWEIAVVPRTLGAGLRLFPEGEARLREWRLTRCREAPGGVVDLHYEPVRQADDAEPS